MRFVWCFRVHLHIMVGRCWASCLTRNLRSILFLLGSPTSPPGIGFNHHRRLCVGLWNPILICVVFSGSFALYGWEVLGFVPHPQPTDFLRRATNQTHKNHRALGFNHHRRLCVGVWNPILICVVFSSSFAIMVGRCWASYLTRNLRIS